MVSADPISVVSARSQPKCLEDENGRVLEKGSAGGGGPRKPRNREITSRYKSPTPTSAAASPSPSPSSARRFASPSVDRAPSGPDVASPKRALSAERRRQSPTRTPETKISNGSVDGALVPKRVAGRSELLWPSTRSIYASMQGEPYSPPPRSPAKSRLDGRGKPGSHASDHTLKPSANVVQRPTDQRKGTPERKGTPLRRQSLDQAENARPSENVHSKPEQHRWPGSSNGKVFGAAMSRSMDLTGGRERPTSRAASLLVQGKSALTTTRVPRPGANSRVLSQSINEGPPPSALTTGTRRTNVDSRGRSRDSPINPRKGLPKDTARSTTSQQVEQDILPVRQSVQEAELASSGAAALAETASDTCSLSSEGTSVTPSLGRGTQGNGTSVKTTRGATVPARFLQDATGRSRPPSEISRLRLSMPESEFSTVAGGKPGNRQKVTPSVETKLGNGFVTSSPWSVSPNHLASAYKSSQQPLSAVKVPPTSPLRSLPSPTRSRGLPLPSPASSFQSSRSSGAAAMLNFGADVRKGKKGLSQVEEAYLHRILHNRLLQWCFVNARAESAMNTQRLAAEKLLFSVWAKTSDLRKSVTTKRIKLQQARQAHKLNSILGAQVSKLEDWSSLQQEHRGALSGAVEALEAAVLRVPVTEGVRADTQAVKEAMGSAVDVVHAVESSVANLLPKLEKTNRLVSELAQVAAQERSLLEECGDLLATASTFEVEERSLRTHLVQLEQERARVLGHLMDSTVAGSDSVLLSSP